jgi:hypothetical protein
LDDVAEYRGKKAFFNIKWNFLGGI